MTRKSEGPAFLTEAELEAKLQGLPELREFFCSAAPLLLIRGRPSAQDPLYELQLAFDLGDRLETWSWLWVDALEGRILRRFPP